MVGGKRTVVWTPAARDCLDEALQYIAADSPATAAKVLEVVLAAAESLSVFSERGRVVPEVGSRSVREIFVYLSGPREGAPLEGAYQKDRSTEGHQGGRRLISSALSIQTTMSGSVVPRLRTTMRNGWFTQIVRGNTAQPKGETSPSRRFLSVG